MCMQGLFPLFLWIPRYTAVYSVWTEFLLVRRKLSKENSCSWALLFNAQNIPNFEFDLTIPFVTEPVLLMNLVHTGRHSPLNLDSQTSEEKGNAVTHLPAHSPLLFLSATWKPACSRVTPPKPLSYQHNSKRPLYLPSPGSLAVHHFLPFSEPFSTMPGELNLNPEFYLCLNMTRKTENPDFTIHLGLWRWCTIPWFGSWCHHTVCKCNCHPNLDTIQKGFFLYSVTSQQKGVTLTLF